MSDYREEPRVSKQILARVVEAYRKFRNTLRYLVSNLYDFDPATDRLPLEALQDVDRYILSRYGDAASAVLRAYEDFDYPTIFQVLNQFLAVDLSAFYADVSKDRLYTFAAGSRERRSAQTAMGIMADGLARLLAPILPVTADELWRFLPTSTDAGAPGREASVHMALFPTGVERLADGALDERWERLRAVRDEVNKALEEARQAKTIGTSLAAHVRLSAGGDIAALLRAHEADLPMLFIVSQVSLDTSGDEGLAVQVLRADGEKCDRCWRIVPERSTEPRFAARPATQRSASVRSSRAERKNREVRR